MFLSLLAFVSIAALPAQAATITDEQITEQKRTVMIELVNVLREDVKLLQLIYIQKLQAQVAYLQALADEQSK
ncbi:hypothetical protein KC902_03150 [Candidatus Kaiserbacteria bacterium]|nr:hypothetical protein [Candidatus Kaiserbacteria bacterium]USN88442.1 MAG: hypothetical protein H6780_03025 [Candidatus Nomurabacteria bacterium]